MTGNDPRRGMVLLIVPWTIALCFALAVAGLRLRVITGHAAKPHVVRAFLGTRGSTLRETA